MKNFAWMIFNILLFFNFFMRHFFCYIISFTLHLFLARLFNSFFLTFNDFRANWNLNLSKGELCNLFLPWLRIFFALPSLWAFIWFSLDFLHYNLLLRWSYLSETYLTVSFGNHDRHSYFPHNAFNGRLIILNWRWEASSNAEGNFRWLLSAHSDACSLFGLMIDTPLPLVCSLRSISNWWLNDLTRPYSHSLNPRNVKILRVIVRKNRHRLIFN